MKKILTILTISFSLFFPFSQVFALDETVYTGKLNSATRFDTSFFDENTQTYSGYTQLPKHSGNTQTFENSTYLNLLASSSGTSGEYLLYSIPLTNFFGENGYQSDYSIHFKFTYMKNTYFTGNMIPYMDFDFIRFLNTRDYYEDLKTQAFFNGDQLNEYGFNYIVDNNTYQTGDDWFYLPKQSSCKRLYGNYNECTVEFDFPEHYFDNVTIEQIRFGFYNADMLPNTSFQMNQFSVKNEYEFYYGEPYGVSNLPEKDPDFSGTLGNINDFLNDDTPPESDISGLGNVQGLLKPGPVDSLLNIPFDFLSILISSFGGTCEPIKFNFVFDCPIEYPCFDSFYSQFPDYLKVFVDTIPSAFILIYYFKHLYKKIDRAVSMESNADDEWGVI